MSYAHGEVSRLTIKRKLVDRRMVWTAALQEPYSHLYSCSHRVCVEKNQKQEQRNWCGHGPACPVKHLLASRPYRPRIDHECGSNAKRMKLRKIEPLVPRTSRGGRRKCQQSPFSTVGTKQTSRCWKRADHAFYWRISVARFDQRKRDPLVQN